MPRILAQPLTLGALPLINTGLMTRSFLKWTAAFAVLHYLVLLALSAGIFLLAHLPTSVLHLDVVIIGLTRLQQMLCWPRTLLMAILPGERTPGFLNLALTIFNSLAWGSALAALKLAWSKLRN
jgi:hypothetical protein